MQELLADLGDSGQPLLELVTCTTKPFPTLLAELALTKKETLHHWKQELTAFNLSQYAD